MSKTVGIVGLGLIGGSIAKCFRKYTDFTIFGYDISSKVRSKALRDGTLDEVLCRKNLYKCDITIVCLYPVDTAEYIEDNIDLFKKESIVVDFAGVKTKICAGVSKLCAEKNIKFVGGHPMAGMEKSGYNYATADLYDGATMVMCTDEFTNMQALNELSNLFLKIGFGRITVTSPEEHDKIIAFTSQLAHVVSNAYVQSDCAKMQMGFSAGSYKDLTRVAYLNEDMWAELFIENAPALANEIRTLCERLTEYADVIDNGNLDRLKDILRTGKEMKVKVG